MNKKICLSIIITLSIIFFGCNDVTPHEYNVNNELNSINYSTSQVWNSNNPYDSVGYKHNQICDYYISNRNSIDTNDMIGSGANVIADYINSNTSESTDSSEISSDFFDTVDDFDDLHNNNLSFDDYITTHFANITTQQQLIAIFDTIMNYKSSWNVNLLVSDIKTIENSISSLSISEQDKEALYKTCAVAKFSAIYWDDASFDPNSSWNKWWEEIDSSSTPVQGIDIAIAAAGDAAGAVSAYVKGDSFWKGLGRTAFASVTAYACAGSAAAGYIGEAVGWAVGFLTSIFGD
jgi:hypothetical protein